MGNYILNHNEGVLHIFDRCMNHHTFTKYCVSNEPLELLQRYGKQVECCKNCFNERADKEIYATVEKYNEGRKKKKLRV